MEIYVYNSDIELKGVIDSFASLRWRRRFFEPGEVELHLPATTESIAMLTEGGILHRLDRREAAVIEGIAVSGGENGDELTVTARMGSCLLSRRIVTPTFSFTGTVEEAMRRLVSDNAITARPIPGLALGDARGYAEACDFQATYKTVLTVLGALARSAPLGFTCRLDVPGKAWVFEVYRGTDRTVTQSALPYVLFSAEFGNIAEPQYTLNSQGYANFAYVGGAGEGSSRTIVQVDRTNGAPRRELWVDAKDLQKGSLTTQKYQDQLTQRGLEKLAAAAMTQSFEAAAVDTANFAYLTDWDLGDIVSFEKWGILLNQRITEAEEVYEGGTETITAVCGTPLPETLIFGSD